MKTILFIVSILAAAGVEAAASATATGRVDVAEGAFHWRAIHSGTCALRWAYPQGASSATVAITNLAGREVFRQSFASPVVTCSWTVVSGEVASDDIFKVTASFDVGEPLVADIALLKSSFGGGAKVLRDGTRPWTCVGDMALVPCKASWVEGDSPALSVARRDLGKSILRDDVATGWYGWSAREWGSGWFDLSFSAEGAEDGLSAQFMRTVPGIRISIR